LAKPHRAAVAGAMRLLFSDVGQAILPAAAFRRLFPGCSHPPSAGRKPAAARMIGWPKDFCRMVARIQNKRNWDAILRGGCRPPLSNVFLRDSMFSTIAAYGKNRTASAAHLSKRRSKTFTTG